MKRWQSIGLGVALSVVALIYTLHGTDLSQIGTELLHGKYLYIFPACLFLFLGFYFRALRWQVLLDNRISVRDAFHLSTIGNFLNSFLPLRLGEVGRVLLAARLTPPIAILTTTSSLVVERLADLLILLVILLWTISLNLSSPSIESAALVMGMLVVGGTVVLIVLAARRTMTQRLINWVVGTWPWLERFNLRSFTEHLLDGLIPLTSVRGLVMIVIWSVLAWAGSMLMCFTLLRIFYDQPSLLVSLVVVETVSIAIALPAMPGNIGPFEAAAVGGLVLVGMVGGTNTTERAIAYGVALHAFLILGYTILGVIGLGQEKISFGELRRLTTRQGKNKEAVK